MILRPRTTHLRMLDKPPIAVLVGNTKATRSHVDSDGFEVSDQLTAVDAGLKKARELVSNGQEVRLLMMLDHKHHGKRAPVSEIAVSEEICVDRRDLLDPEQYEGGVTIAAAKWPTLDLLHPSIVRPFKGLLDRYGFAPSNVRVLPEQSVFWHMQGLFARAEGFPDYDLSGTNRRLYSEIQAEGDEEITYSPRCIGILAGCMLLASTRKFVRSSVKQATLDVADINKAALRNAHPSEDYATKILAAANRRAFPDTEVVEKILAGAKLKLEKYPNRSKEILALANKRAYPSEAQIDQILETARRKAYPTSDESELILDHAASQVENIMHRALMETQDRSWNNYAAVLRGAPLRVIAHFEVDGVRVTKALAAQAKKLIVSPNGFGLDEELLNEIELHFRASQKLPNGGGGGNGSSAKVRDGDLSTASVAAGSHNELNFMLRG